MTCRPPYPGTYPCPVRPDLRSALSRHVVVADGAWAHDAADVRSLAGRFRRPGGLQRDPERDASRRRQGHPRRVLRGRLRPGDGEHVRREPRRARRVRHRRPHRRAGGGRRAPGARGGRPGRPPTSVRATCWARSVRGQAAPRASGTSSSRRCGTPTPSRRGRSSPAASTGSSSRPAGPPAGQGGHHRGEARAGRGDEPAHGRQRDRRDDGHDADGLRDRRRAHGARAARHRPHRAQLRDRARGGGRAPAPPRAPGAHRPELHAERGPARTDADGARYPRSRPSWRTRWTPTRPSSASRSWAAAAARRPSTSGRSPSGWAGVRWRR